MAPESPKRAGLQITIHKSKSPQLQRQLDPLDPKKLMELVPNHLPAELVPKLVPASALMRARAKAERVIKEVFHQ